MEYREAAVQEGAEMGEGADGGWEGARILEGSGARGLPSEPAAFLTRLDLPIRSLPAMWLSAAPGILTHIPCGPDLAIAVGVVDRPYVQPMTFTLWRSAE